MSLKVPWDDEISDLLPLTAVEDLFLLYCNEETDEAKITLTLTDNLYKRRYISAGDKGLSQLSKKAWHLFLSALLPEALGSSISPALIFLKCLGFNNEKKFTLNFTQFIDALYYVAASIYAPESSPSIVIRALVQEFLLPLYQRVFRDYPANHKDDVSVVSHSSSVRSRVSQLILTPSGVAPISSVDVERPAALVPIGVDSLVDQKPGNNTTLLGASSVSSIQLPHQDHGNSTGEVEQLKATISSLITIVNSLRAENALLRSSQAR
jgi:hypothetical protein